MKYISLVISTVLILCFLSCEKERTFQLVDQEFSLSQDTLFIKSTSTSAGFFIKVNAGYLSYQIKGIPSWFYIYNAQGQASSSGAYIELIINQSEPQTTIRKATLTIETPLGNKNVLVIFVPINASGAFVQNNISILGNTDSKTLNIINPENVKITWNATIDNDYITLSKTGGNMNIGDADVLNITVNKGKLPGNGNYISNITFVANGKTYKTKVTINNQLLGLLDRNVVDAVFAGLREEICYVSDAPKSITRFNPETNQHISLNLNLVPICLAVSQDNKTAVIGCDARIIVVDLDNMVVTKTISVDSKVNNIMLAPNNFAYSISDGTGWSYLTEVNLATGTFKSNPQIIYSGSVGRLHPNGKWIYVADNGVSPADVRKFSLANNGTSTYLYDSPYHGDYNIGGGVWFSESGDRMLSGSVFLTASMDENKDLRYVGSLNLPAIDVYGSRIWSAVHSASSNKVYLSLVNLYGEKKFSDKLYVYDSESFELLNTIDMIPITDQNGDESPAQPRFVFAAKNAVYVLNKAQSIQKWSVQILEK